MTGIDFHFNAPDKLGYTCRLVRKIHGRGSTVLITADDATLDAIDAALWSFSETDFLPHVRTDTTDAAVVARTPIVLSPRVPASPLCEVMVNLGREVPQGFERHARLVEVVGTDDADRAAGRQRFRHYRDRGYTLSTHDVSGGG